MKSSGPNPLELLDVNSKNVNGALTPGGLCNLFGSGLKFDETDPSQGIFVISEDGQEVRVQVVSVNRPRLPSFQLPMLAPGVYELEVRAIPYRSRNLYSQCLYEKLFVPEALPATELPVEPVEPAF